MSWGVLFFALIPILLGAGFIVAGSMTRGASTEWQQAQGMITPSTWGIQWRRGQRFRWQGPDGVVRDGQGYSTTIPKPDGAPVTVLYDPQNPDRFRLSSDQSSGTVFVVLGWVFTALGVLALIVLSVLVAVLT